MSKSKWSSTGVFDPPEVLDCVVLLVVPDVVLVVGLVVIEVDVDEEVGLVEDVEDVEDVVGLVVLPVPPVVMVKDGKARYVIKPQTYEDIVRNDI